MNEISEYCKSNNIVYERIYTDQQTGKIRPRYTVFRDDILGKRDCLIISELDRLGRNKHDTLNDLHTLKDKGVRVMILKIPTTLMDVSKMENSMALMIIETINNMLFEFYATMAQAEIEKKRNDSGKGSRPKKIGKNGMHMAGYELKNPETGTRSLIGGPREKFPQ